MNLGKMISLSAALHREQLDKAGKPYILHCIKVLELLNSDDEELNCIAVGHDLIEDTVTTQAILRMWGCSERIVEGILAMTRGKRQSYSDYKKQIKANPDAILVKIADLTHNMDISRIITPSEGDYSRVEKYAKFLKELKLIVELDTMV